MSTAAVPTPLKAGSWRTPIVLIAVGCAIALIAFGPRSAIGQFLTPMSFERGWGRETFSFAIAIQNLLWGAAQPFAGNIADRFGPVRVLSAGAILYAIGLVGMANATSTATLDLSAGVIIGFGLAGCSFPMVIGALGKLVPEGWRAFAFGAGTASGSFGQFLYSPLAHSLIEAFSWQTALMIFAGTLLLVLPLSLVLATPPGAGTSTVKLQTGKQALSEAFGHRSYVLLVLGFFTCGFQLAFVTVHLPSYLVDRGLGADIGAWTIALIGLFNIVGSLGSGWLSGRMPKRYLLSIIYFSRALSIVAFIVFPATTASTLLFGAVTGLLWLSTVPPTSGLVALMFGTRWLTMLFGFAFFSHQVGGFLGVWLGGLAFEATGSYNLVWWLSVFFGVASAVINLPIVEKPVAPSRRGVGLTVEMSTRLATWRTPLIILLSGCLIGMISFGPRSTFGFFLTPMTAANGWGRDTFSLALAIEMLLWGVGQPVAGALADRFGAPLVLAGGALLYIAGIVWMAFAQTPLELHLSAGVLIGFGLAACSFTLIIGAFAKLLPPQWRSIGFGVGTAAGSFGQFLFSPLAVGLIDGVGWQNTLLVFGAILLPILPLSFVLAAPPRPAGASAIPSQGIKDALAEAFGHRSYVLLILGYFTCGFQLFFITVHLPAYLIDRGLPASIGGWTIAVIGLFNIFGSIGSGYVANMMPKRYLLSAIYFSRSLAIMVFILLPPSPAVTLVFGAVIGVLWLSTIPPTSALVAIMFGPRWLTMLLGLAFFVHQVGGFLGVWLGGVLFERTGSYDVVWWGAIFFGVASAIINLPIVEKPVPRPVAVPA